MASRGNETYQQLTQRPPSVRYRTRATYDTLMRQSRKLGKIATQAMTGAGQGVRQIFGRPQIYVPDKLDSVGELERVIAHSHEIIAGAKTVLPLFFPNEIILDRTKVTIIKRVFFWSTDVISIRIEDVLNVSGSVGPLFGSVTIASRVMSTIDHFQVDYFWRDDATRMARVIEGYLVARQNGISTDHLDCRELADVLCGIRPEKKTS